jgi:hypothetical protein
MFQIIQKNGACMQHAYQFEDENYFWVVKQTRNKTKKQ